MSITGEQVKNLGMKVLEVIRDEEINLSIHTLTDVLAYVTAHGISEVQKKAGTAIDGSPVIERLVGELVQGIMDHYSHIKSGTNPDTIGPTEGSA